MGKVVIQIDLNNISDKLINKKAHDDTGLKEFTELVNKVEKIKKTINGTNSKNHSKL